MTTNAIISGCSVNEDSPNIEIDPRLVFIDGKTDLEIKEGFSNLDFEGQKEIWISKLKQVLKTSIGQDQKEYINILISEFEKSNKTTSDCTATSSGCGFLWLQSCEKRDYI